MPIFGFNRQRAGKLKTIADREGLKPRGKGGAAYPADNQSVDLVWVAYKCTTLCPAYGAMRVTGAVLDSNDWPTLTTIKPDTTFSSLYLVNGPGDAVDGGDGYYYGIGTYLPLHGGPSFVLCDSTYVPTVGQEWGPISGSWALVRHRPGFLIDGGPTGSGATYRAVAKQRVVTSLVGKADGSAVVDTGTFTCSVWMRNAATGTLEDSGYDIASCLAWGAAITATRKVSILLHGGQWLGAPWQC